MNAHTYPISICCPTCGHALAHAPEPHEINLAGITSHQRVILSMMVKAYPHSASADDMAGRLYAGTKDGPADEMKAVQESIRKMRKRLNTIGWTISPSPRGRGVKGEYRLERVSP